jgi:GTP-binding protein
VKDIEQEKFLARLRHHFNFMMWVPAIFVSAKTGRNVNDILDLIKSVATNQRTQINTSKLNRIIEDFALSNTVKGLGTFRPKLFFGVQTGKTPPTFTITAKHHGFIHFAWRRALENELRRHFDFSGTPIKVIFKAK